jgi:hypothetical protein
VVVEVQILLPVSIDTLAKGEMLLIVDGQEQEFSAVLIPP